MSEELLCSLRVALHSASSSASSSMKFDCCLLPTCFLVPPLHARAKWPTIPHLLHLLPNAGQWCWRGLGWLLRNQKHSGVGGAEVWFSRVDLFMKFTCSRWVLRTVLINWFAKVVFSKLFAISTTSRNLSLVCAASRCLWPLPISFTLRVSDVKPAINWSCINSSAKFSYSHCKAWFRIRVSQEPIDSSLFCIRRRNLSFTGDPDACAIIFSQGINNQVRFRQIFGWKP